jgi:hypothetical protein
MVAAAALPTSTIALTVSWVTSPFTSSTTTDAPTTIVDHHYKSELAKVYRR